MTKVIVRNGNVDSALRTFKQKTVKEGLLKEVRKKESLFCVAHYSNDEWEFDFISDQSTMPGVIRNIDQMLASVCDIENYVEKNATSIENISPGKLERNGENLVVIKKAVVRLK